MLHSRHDGGKMFEIIKSYKEHLPSLRLIGKRYTDSDRVNGSFGEKWEEWFKRGWFDELEKSVPPLSGAESGYLGLMTVNPETNGDFAYWIGSFAPAGTDVPQGFSHLDLPESDAGVFWIYGSRQNGEIYGEKPHTAAYEMLRKNGWGENNGVFFERYNCPRFTNPDEKDNVILDYVFYLK
jgi:predicted transcriptional regulator YdeE